jgi:hypothetical protein
MLPAPSTSSPILRRIGANLALKSAVAASAIGSPDEGVARTPEDLRCFIFR